MGEVFDRKMWQAVAKGLRGMGERWWEENRDDLVDLTREEAEDMLRAFRDGDTVAAKMAIVTRLYADDRGAWEAYRDSTTAHLQGIAARRVRIMEALGDIGTRAARVIGQAAAAALGL